MSEACCPPAAAPRPPAPPAPYAPGSWRWTALLSAAAVSIAAGGALAWAGRAEAAAVVWALAIALAGVPPARRAVRALRVRALDINVLMVVAVAGAAALGEWLEAATVVWLFGVAQWLEVRSLDRAREAIRALMTLAPDEALVRRDGVDAVRPVADVRVGDLVLVGPGERVPVDGVVRAGRSALDQSPVTGESLPADKEPGDEVFAGTINGAGALDVEARRPAADSTIARIIRLVERAQRQRAPVETFVDRFARRYTPAVVLLAVVVAVGPPLVLAAGASEAFAVWTYRALALLVVACPCALVISTPVSVVSGLAAAARRGVLIKGGAHLERLGGIRCVAFDKTGTLTEGRVSVTDVAPVDGGSRETVLAVAAALEARSEHPIGRAIVDRARRDGLAVAPGLAFRALPGLGAEAEVHDAPAIVGSHRLFEERRLCTPALHDRLTEVAGAGAMPVLVGHRGVALGVIGLADEARAGGPEAVRGLRGEGVGRVVLLTGDARRAADALAAAAGLDEAHADLLPADKVRIVGDLRARYGSVAMVGDGVNDAPALAAADVGIAMGAAGTHVALETADVALMSDDLSRLPWALRLGRATLANIRANVALALGLKLAFVVLAAAGLATLWMAVVADTGASLLVTANGMRLLRVR